MKKLFSSLISITLVLGLVNIRQAQARLSLPARQRGRSTIRFVPRVIRGANKKLRYTIKAKYPQAVSGRDARLEKLNQALRNLIAGEVNAFKKDFQAPEERMSTVGSYLESGYAVVLATNDLVSISFMIDTYFEGAAHGNHNSLVFNYDLNTGKRLSLAELFKPNSNYLKLISDYSIKALTKELGPDPDNDWIQRGAGASEENYRNWTISRKGLEVTFDPYQVASYAEGPHDVVIPYSVLKNVIDPAGPLSRIVKTAPQATRTGESKINSGQAIPSGSPTRPPKINDLGTGTGYGSGVGEGTGLGPGRGVGVDEGGGSRVNSGPVDPNKIYNPRDVDVKARIISRPEPQMTEAAKKNDVNGTVVLRAVLSANGQVVNIRVVSGLPDGLTKEAVEAARRIKFIPAMKNGQPVSQFIQIEYNFNSY